MMAAIIFRGVIILADLLVNGIVISILIMMVAGAQIGEVSKSASPPPIAAAAKA